MKAVADKDGENQVGFITTTACGMVLAAKSFALSFYLKGKPGGQVKVSLIDNYDLLSSSTIFVPLSEWKWVTVNLTSDRVTSKGRIKFEFNSEGTYWIDEVYVREGGSTTWYVSPQGTDSLTNNNGSTTAKPLKTIQYALDEAWKSGDVVEVMAGVY